MSGVKKKKIFLMVGIFLTVVFWTAAGIWLVRSLTDKERADKQIGETQSLVSTSEVEMPTADSEEVETEGSSVKLLEVDLAKLIERNSDTAGWIQIMGTNINYPFVQTSDNTYYQTHSFDKSYNPAGWVYLDSRNASSLSDTHNIIYLHGKLEGTEFEPARSVISSTDWLDNPGSFIMRTSTKNSSELWQVFSIYKIPTTEDYLKLDFTTPAEKTNFIEKLAKRSVYNFQVPFSETDKILTFSIRYSDDYIVAIHGKLLQRDTASRVSPLNTISE